MKKINKDIFLEDAKRVYGDKYDYSLILNVSSKKEKVPIICPKHGVFYRNYNVFVTEQKGCPQCRPPRHRWTQEEVVGKIHEFWGDKYDTSKVEFHNCNQKLTLLCKEHGEFKIDFVHILRHQGCPKCAKIKQAKSLRRNIDDVIHEANLIHNGKYDYSLIKDYKNDRTKYPIVCPIHGVFYQTFNNHIHAKQGCPLCGRIQCDESRKTTFQKFIEQAALVHNNKYEYLEQGFLDTQSYVSIICPTHGEFQQKASNHLNGQGCPLCSRIESTNKLRLTKEEFIEKAKSKHGDKYDYSQTEYTKMSDKVTIICKTHVAFTQCANNHIVGNGCPRCKESSMEREIGEMLTAENIQFIHHYKPIFLLGQHLDYYLPDYSIAIECQGGQHFYPVDYFGGEEGFAATKERDKKKLVACAKKGIEILYYANYQYDFPHKVYTEKKELLQKIKKV